MKKTTYLIITAIFAMAAYQANAADFEFDGISYNVIDPTVHTCSVTNGSTAYQGDIVIPATVKYQDQDYTVVSVGKAAFSKCGELTSVSLPETVTAIGMNAFFRCAKLTEVNIPQGVTAVADWSFNGCAALKEIILPQSVTKIGESAFEGCSSLTSITMSKNIRSIGEWSFSNCKKLECIQLPEGLTQIADYTFNNCFSLSEINIPSGVEYIGESAFSGCNGFTEIVLPQELSEVGDSAFGDCENLVNIVFNQNLTQIGYGMFNGCSSLEEIEIPATINHIGEAAFGGCSALKNVKLNQGLTSIGASAFTSCSSLETIELPQTLTTMEGWIFQGCSSLKSIVIPDGVSKIETSTFKNCTKLTEIELSENLTAIGGSAFDGCKSLKNLVIPAGVKNLVMNALCGLTSLECLQVNSDEMVVCANASTLRGMPTTCLLQVPAQCVPLYRLDEIWSSVFAPENIVAINGGSGDDNSEVATFENLELAPESYWAGDDEGEEVMYGMAYKGVFHSGTYSFDNYFVDMMDCWFGYAYSNMTSTEFNSLDDQYNSCVGSGFQGSANYMVAYPDHSMWGPDYRCLVSVTGDARVVPGFYITNSAYTISSMINGDSFVGEPFHVGDFYKITIHALDEQGNETASRDFCLADYRFKDEADRYMITEWTYVDLSQLGEAAAFYFTFDGTRKSGQWMSIPTYFCVDNFGDTGEENVREEGSYTGESTSIDTLNNDYENNTDTVIYNLQGIRLNHISTPGIYIVNGRKVMHR